MIRVLISMAFLTLFTSCKHAALEEGFVPVVGLNSQGKSELKKVPKNIFLQEMSPFIGKMSNAVTDTLDREESMEQNPWTLSRVTVGLALEAELEVIEDILGVEGHADIELRFQKAN